MTCRAVPLRRAVVLAGIAAWGACGRSPSHEVAHATATQPGRDAAGGRVTGLETELARRAHRAWIAPVITGLRRNPDGSRETLELLRNLDLTTSPRPLDHLGPNALAYRDRGRAVVRIDVAYLARMSSLANLAGLALTGRDDAGPILYEIGFRYAQDASAALIAGDPLPPLHVELAQFTSDRGLIAMAEGMSMEAFMAGVTWVVLHEVGHHRLGHLARAPRDRRESRAWELEADRWAFGEMQRMGYGLAPLQAMLGALQVEEQLMLMMELVPAEDQSTHPSYATRGAALTEYGPDRPPGGPWIMIVHYVGDGEGGFLAQSILVPAAPGATHPMGAAGPTGGIVWMPYEHLPTGEIRLYGRTGDELSQITIHSTTALKPRLTFRYARVGGSWTVQSSVGMRVDPKYFEEATVGPLKVWQVLELDPVAMLVRIVRRVDGRAFVVTRAASIQRSLLISIRETAIAYASGRITLREAERQMTRRAHVAAAELESLLGPDGYRHVQRLMFEDGFVQWGVETFLERRPEF